MIASSGYFGKQERDRREKAFQNDAAYAGMVENNDENLGRLLRRLDELQLSDETIVVGTSDNGGKGSGSNRAVVVATPPAIPLQKSKNEHRPCC